MNKCDEVKFKELLAMITENYSFVFSPANMKLWSVLFKPYSIEVFESALASHMVCPDSGMFTPKPANLMKFINGTTKQLDQDVNDKTELAWAQVIDKIRTVGSWGTLKLDDKQALAAVRSLGSWKQLCGSTENDMTWKKKEFMRIYQTYENTPIDMLPSSLPGLIDLKNHKIEESSKLKSIQDGINEFRNKSKLKLESK